MASVAPPDHRGTTRAWLSISDAARALGVSTSTLRAWAAEGRVPHVRTAGGHRRFSPDALAEWLAERPAPGATREEKSTHVAPCRDAAEAMERRAADIAARADGHFGLAEAPGSADMAPADRRRAARDWVLMVAAALRTGRLAEALTRAEAHGRMHGAAGSPAEAALAGALAMERAVDDALALEDVTHEERDHVAATMRRITVRIADAWARAAAARRTGR